jgi:hypothetical protein
MVGGVSPGKQAPSECQMLTVTFLGSFSQFGTTYPDLGSEEIGSLRDRQNVMCWCQGSLPSQARVLAHEAAE